MRLLIGIVSCRKYAGRRQACRTAWVQAAEKHPWIDVMFVVGSPKVTEPTLGGDTLYVPCPDDLDHLPSKILWLAYWASRQDFDYLFKCEDDTYVHVDRLAVLARDGAAHDYTGYEFDPGCAQGGAGYLLSFRSISWLAEIPDRANQTGPEDAAVAKWLAPAGIGVHHDPKFWPWPHRVPTVWNEQITSHGMGARELLQSRETIPNPSSSARAGIAWNPWRADRTRDAIPSGPLSQATAPPDQKGSPLVIHFILTVYAEPAAQLAWCARHLRHSYPDSLVTVISDGRDLQDWRQTCDEYRLAYHPDTRRLKALAHGAQWWQRFCKVALAGPGEYIVKMDPDTLVQRPLCFFPLFDLFGTMQDDGIIQGGFQMFARSAVEKMAASGICLDSTYSDPIWCLRDPTLKRLNDLKEISTDYTLADLVGRLGLRIGNWPQVDSIWKRTRPFRTHGVCVTHPHKIERILANSLPSEA